MISSKTLHRIILEQYLEKYSKFISGNILDIGSKNRRYDHLFEGKITAVDINPNPEMDIMYGEIIDLPFNDSCFNAVISIEVLEYIDLRNIPTAIKEIIRVLQNNGYCIISIPFMYREHDDKIRMTYAQMNSLLKDYMLSDYSIHKIGNSYTIISDILKIKTNHFKSRMLRGILSRLLTLIPLVLDKFFSIFTNKGDGFYSGLLIIFKK